MNMEQMPVADEAEELDHRREGGVDVKLMWHRASNTPYIVLTEVQANVSYAFIVEGENAGDAFDHPYFYAQREGVYEGTAEAGV